MSFCTFSGFVERLLEAFADDTQIEPMALPGQIDSKWEKYKEKPLWMCKVFGQKNISYK